MTEDRTISYFFFLSHTPLYNDRCRIRYHSISFVVAIPNPKAVFVLLYINGRKLPIHALSRLNTSSVRSYEWQWQFSILVVSFGSFKSFRATWTRSHSNAGFLPAKAWISSCYPSCKSQLFLDSSFLSFFIFLRNTFCATITARHFAAHE